MESLAHVEVCDSHPPSSYVLFISQYSLIVEPLEEYPIVARKDGLGSILLLQELIIGDVSLLFRLIPLYVLACAFIFLVHF